MAKHYDRYKLRPQEELIVALDDLDFSWFPVEVNKVKKLWSFGWHIADIAKHMKRDPDEVAVLIMHLARQGRIRRRRMGVLGN